MRCNHEVAGLIALYIRQAAPCFKRLTAAGKPNWATAPAGFTLTVCISHKGLPFRIYRLPARVLRGRYSLTRLAIPLHCGAFIASRGLLAAGRMHVPIQET